jgi:hypothetical protein
MDINCDCVWKNKKHPEECKNPKRKEICHCNLEPCSLYKKKSLINIIKIKLNSND